MTEEELKKELEEMELVDLLEDMNINQVEKEEAAEGK